MRNIYRTLGITLFAFVATAAPTFGQEPKSRDEQEAMRPAANQPQDDRAKILQQLGLSREQFQMLRRINADRKPLMDAAQARLRMSIRLLDDAIYADQVNEPEIQARLKDMQLAQAEVFRIRFMNELAIRRLLTPPQLLRFRQMRQRFENARANEDRRRVNQARPGQIQRGTGFQNVKSGDKPINKP